MLHRHLYLSFSSRISSFQWSTIITMKNQRYLWSLSVTRYRLFMGELYAYPSHKMDFVCCKEAYFLLYRELHKFVGIHMNVQPIYSWVWYYNNVAITNLIQTAAPRLPFPEVVAEEYYCCLAWDGGWKHIIHYTHVIMGTIASQITSLTIVYSTVYSSTDRRKHQSSASLAFAWGIHRGSVNSPHKWPVTRKMFPFDDVIMFMQF